MKIVLLHGLGQDGSAWNKVMSYLGDIEGEALELFDEGRLPSSYHLLEETVRHQIKMIADDVIVVGLSLGGSLAYSLMKDTPENVKGFVVCAGQYRVKGNPIFHIQKAIFKLMPRFIFKKQGFDKTNMMQFYQSMEDFDVTDYLLQTSLPCRLVCGSKDKANLKSAKTATSLIAQGSYQELEGAGHLLTTDAPKALANVILDFYREIVK